MVLFDDFLGTTNSIGEYQAEYGILSSMYYSCENMVFLFELVDINDIKIFFQEAVNYINRHYRSFNVQLFYLTKTHTFSSRIVVDRAGASIKDEDLINIAINTSRDNHSYVLVRARTSLTLFHNGVFARDFENSFADKKKMIEAERRKYNIDQLEQVFNNFHFHRMYQGCEYVENGKVSNSISEQQLRNHLMKYLLVETNCRVIPELCTSFENDEESVDISLIDKDQSVAIIEVKYFVKKGYFEDSNKSAYSPSRFSNGYTQLNRYCIHLNRDSYNLHSAFLYMFYAHSNTLDEVRKDAQSYLDAFLLSPSCSDHFRHHYCATICDNILDQKRVV